MIGRERDGMFSTNHMRAFSYSFSKAETWLNAWCTGVLVYTLVTGTP